jgi:fibronectin type 3 domain-containing protein
VGWRGNGTFNAPQFPTNTWSVGTGIHEFVIRGREASCQWKDVMINVAGSATTPSAPTALQVVSGNASNVLTWVTPASDGGASIGGYYIYRSTTSGAETFLTSVTGTGYTNASLVNGTTYFYKVSATNSVGEGTKSGEATGTPSTLPGAPQNLIVTPWQSSLQLNWDAPASDGGSTIIGYKIYRSSSAGTEMQYDGLIQNLYYFDAGVTAGNTYYYKVSPVNADGEGTLSSEANGTAAVFILTARGRLGRR